jgi:hypothetical protein
MGIQWSSNISRLLALLAMGSQHEADITSLAPNLAAMAMG